MSEQKPAKYWVLHFEKRDREPNQVRKEWLPPFAVQLMSSSGGPSVEVVYFDQGATNLEIKGALIPDCVIEVVKTLPEGEGRYFDEDGVLVEPF